ncbi:hypothetical protein K439DRAFT_1620951 [Ramaria rubella]|nr:hypothetical protein K439DRAFT_1620951 [Ramaria rubella]
MRPATIAKWLEEHANAPPPPMTPAGLPDDSVSTVYPESSVSNPYASRYTGTRHRSSPLSRPPVPADPYLERRPSSAQAHHRDHHQIIVTPRPQRHRHNSFSAESRYMPSQPQPFAYYSQPHTNQTYYAPASAHTRSPSHGRDGGRTSPTSQPYRAAASPSPNRAEASRSHERQYASYGGAYHSTPTITLQTRSTTTKKPPLLRRIFGGIEWGSAPSRGQPPRDTSRSSSKSKSKSHSRSSDRESVYRPSRGRSHSDGVVYVRY